MDLGWDRGRPQSVVTDRCNWLFAKDAATVHFAVYAVESFAAGEFGVEIPLRDWVTSLPRWV
jgi:hypothetical protein